MWIVNPSKTSLHLDRLLYIESTVYPKTPIRQFINPSVAIRVAGAWATHEPCGPSPNRAPDPVARPSLGPQRRPVETRGIGTATASPR